MIGIDGRMFQQGGIPRLPAFRLQLLQARPLIRRQTCPFALISFPLPNQPAQRFGVQPSFFADCIAAHCADPLFAAPRPGGQPKT